MVVAATGDDEDNLVISLLAKQEFAVPRVIARVNHPKNEWLFNENWGVDVSVSTPHLILALTEEALSVGSLVRLLQLEKGQARLVEVTLADDSPVIGPSIRELNVPRDATFVAVLREDHVVVPRGDTVFEAGDEVIALVTPGLGGRDPPDADRQIARTKGAPPPEHPRTSRLLGEELVDRVVHEEPVVEGGDHPLEDHASPAGRQPGDLLAAEEHGGDGRPAHR